MYAFFWQLVNAAFNSANDYMAAERGFGKVRDGS
jgi:hypothetical protein